MNYLSKLEYLQDKLKHKSSEFKNTVDEIARMQSGMIEVNKTALETLVNHRDYVKSMIEAYKNSKEAFGSLGFNHSSALAEGGEKALMDILEELDKDIEHLSKEK